MSIERAIPEGNAPHVCCGRFGALVRGEPVLSTAEILSKIHPPFTKSFHQAFI
jgi:hypothetical protein